MGAKNMFLEHALLQTDTRNNWGTKNMIENKNHHEEVQGHEPQGRTGNRPRGSRFKRTAARATKRPMASGKKKNLKPPTSQMANLGFPLVQFGFFLGKNGFSLVNYSLIVGVDGAILHSISPHACQIWDIHANANMFHKFEVHVAPPIKLP